MEEKPCRLFFIQQRRLIAATIRFFDLFSGIGGFREGLRRAGGFTCVGHCEVDAYADKNYRLLFDTEGEWFCNDARTIETERMPDFDLLCAGFPCQAFSIAGKREGFADARGTLFFEIARLVADKRPAYFILENVPGLLSHDKGRTFHTILSTLSELGYGVEWKVLNSKDFGVPQSRKRVYLVGYLDRRCAGKILPFPAANGTSLIQIRTGSQGKRVYSPEGLSCTLTSLAGGMGGKTGLYEMGIPIKENTKQGYKMAYPGDSMVGTGKGASNGILIKSAEALETAHSIDTVVLDKTGTITQGTPVVTNMLCKEGVRQKELLQIAASLEKLSEHPLADAIVAEAEKTELTFLPVDDFKQIPGQGLVGQIENKMCLAGNRRLMAANGINGGELLQLGEEMAVDGKTPLFFARGGQLIGVIAVADVVKPTSKQAIAELTGMGIEVVMLTGDNAKTAEAIRRQVGVNRVVAEVFPQDKEKEIRRLQSAGKKVAMVGDGINDAPALARADVGIAIGAGTDVAIESADIVLMKSDLLDVSTAIQLSKAVIRNIKQNLFWAFIYNIIGIPVAAGLFYLPFGLKLNPMIGAFAMSFSSVFVVSNALRLRWFKAKHTSHTEPDTSQMYEQKPIQKEDKGVVQMEKVMNIEGMVCGNCVKHVDKALREIEGITQVEVSLEKKMAQVQLNQDVPDDVLKTAVEEAGYQVVSIQ